MYRIKYKSSDNILNCDFKININVSKEKIEKLISVLMLHLETNLGVINNKILCDKINNLRTDFLNKVLELLVNNNIENGIIIPKEITQYLTNNNKNIKWDYDE